MEALQREIERKRARGSEPPGRAGKKQRKWKRRGDIEAEEAAERLRQEQEEAAAVAATRAARQAEVFACSAPAPTAKETAAVASTGLQAADDARGGRSSDAADDTAGGSGTGAAARDSVDGHSDGVRLPVVPRHEVVRRLRLRKEPITLFGEADQDRLRRLLVLEAREPDGDAGQGDDFRRAIELDKKQSESMESREAEQERRRRQLLREARDQRDLEDKSRYGEVLRFFKSLLNQWERELDDRSEEVRKTPQGRQDTGVYKQCREYIRPLFQQLRTKAVPDDIILHVENIVKACQARDYILANDHYMRLAIGNAAWPMGVTMVGIHERSGREKIFSGNVAHVLNDENQRRYIQSIKRLMTYCEKTYPPSVDK